MHLTQTVLGHKTTAVIFSQQNKSTEVRKLIIFQNVLLSCRAYIITSTSSGAILDLGRFSQVRTFAELACPTELSPLSSLGVSKTKNRSRLCGRMKYYPQMYNIGPRALSSFLTPACHSSSCVWPASNCSSVYTCAPRPNKKEQKQDTRFISLESLLYGALFLHRLR